MSQQLYLVDYQCDPNGRLYEPEKAVILSSFVDNELVDILSKLDLLEEFKLYEDSSFESYTEVTRLKEDQIGAALECLTSRLIQLIESDRVENLKSIQSEAEISSLMGDFQVISGAYRLIKLKRDNFAHSVAAVVMLG